MPASFVTIDLKACSGHFQHLREKTQGVDGQHTAIIIIIGYSCHHWIIF